MTTRLSRFRYLNTGKISELLLEFYLFQLIITTVLRYILNKNGISEGFLREFVLWIFTSIPLLLMINFHQIIPKKSKTIFLVLMMSIIYSIASSYITNYENRYFLLRSGYGINRVLRPDASLYAFLFFLLVDDYNSLYKIIKKAAIAYFIYFIIVLWIPSIYKGYWEDIDYAGNIVKRNYSLSFGYSISFVCVLFMYYYLKEKKLTYLILNIFCYYLILTNGSRGALLISPIFLVLFMISEIRSKNEKYKYIKILLLLLLITVIIIFGKSLLYRFMEFLYNNGVNSRNIYSFVSEDIRNDTGRSLIWNGVIDAIKKNYIVGYGFFGDRKFVFPYHYAAYSHNIFLELICSYGILGMCLSILLILISLYMIIFYKSDQWRELFIIFFSVSLQLLLSYSFWYVFEFWAMLSIAVRCIILKHNGDAS